MIRNYLQSVKEVNAWLKKIRSEKSAAEFVGWINECGHVDMLNVRIKQLDMNCYWDEGRIYTIMSEDCRTVIPNFMEVV